MIQHIQIDHTTHDAVTQAAKDSGMTYDAYLAWIVCDWAQTYQRRQNGRQEFIDALGVIPGGD